MSTEKVEQDAGGGHARPLCVQVIYADVEQIWRRSLQLAPGATAGAALSASGFFRHFPCHAPESVRIGIYGRLCTMDTRLNDNDRIEVYRPLIFDPMESRRRRARHRQRIKQGKA